MSNETNTAAAISPATFEIDGKAHPGVITATRWENGQLEIILQPLCQLPAGMTDLRVILDDEDLRSVNALLRVQANEEDGEGNTDVTNSAL